MHSTAGISEVPGRTFQVFTGAEEQTGNIKGSVMASFSSGVDVNCSKKLYMVGPVDNRPSNDKLNHFVQIFLGLQHTLRGLKRYLERFGWLERSGWLECFGWLGCHCSHAVLEGLNWKTIIQGNIYLLKLNRK